MRIPTKTSKYKAVRTTIDGITFASQREANRYAELKLLVKAKTISDLRMQYAYIIAINGVHICNYIADFRYIENGQVVVEDAKGVRTPVYKLKKKLVEAAYNVKILEV